MSYRAVFYRYLVGSLGCGFDTVFQRENTEVRTTGGAMA